MDFDDIIVGAGAAGSVLARRLSEGPARKEVILSAGTVETPLLPERSGFGRR